MFGESIFYKQLGSDDKGDPQWHDGIWVGTSSGSNEHIIATNQGVVRAFAVRRKPQEDRWNAEQIDQIQGTPSQPDPTRPGIRIPIRVNFDPIPSDIASPYDGETVPAYTAKSVYIKPWMLEKWGRTEGCPECDRQAAGTATPN